MGDVVSRGARGVKKIKYGFRWTITNVELVGIRD